MQRKDCSKTVVGQQEEKSVLSQLGFNGALEDVCRRGAQQMLAHAMENEVSEYIRQRAHERDENGRQVVVRNGYHRQRALTTGVGSLAIEQPRVHDKSGRQKFTSSILPKYMRRVPSIDVLIPVLYLKGISTGDFTTALEAILGPAAPGLSAANITRLKQVWETEYHEWRTRSLKGKRYVYWWVDGIYFNVRLDDERQCMLVIIGATENGTKELIAVCDGFRESKQSWLDVFTLLKNQGLEGYPALAIGDGGLGFWAALSEKAPRTRQQRCWVHKTANILDKLPESEQGKAKTMIHDMYLSSTKADALKAYDAFLTMYGKKHERACECLTNDKDELFTFYDFPAEHWPHIRTTNPIESTFATVRLRTKRTKGCGSRIATLTMVYKLVGEAEKRWNRLHGHKLIEYVMLGERFIDGIREQAA